MAVPSLPSSATPASAGRSKADWRRHGLELRRDYARSLGAEQRRALQEALRDIVVPRLITARIIGLYHPLRDEIDPQPIADALAERQKAAFPWFASRDSRMIWRAGPAAEPSPWGMLQPPGTAPALAPDLVIVPLVIADRRGTRIGHGKGHFDRALSHLREAGPVFTLGVGWEPQLVDETLPRDAWDIPLDAVATPAGWVDCR